MKQDVKGITLIALVITIIVLLILAGVTIATLTGENGLLGRANTSAETSEIAQLKEEIRLEILGWITENDGKAIDSVNLKKIIEKHGASLSEDGQTVIINGKEISISDIYNGKVETKGVSVGDLFDITGEVEGKLHIGDFVDYTTGVWTEEDMNKITNSGAKIAPNNQMSVPKSNYQFGGFTIGSSIDGNATLDNPYNQPLSYNTDKETGKEITGWRIFDITDNGEIILISAGCPEDYYYPNGPNNAYITEYILTGNVNANATSLGLETNYTPRDWSMYVNGKAKSARVMNLADINNWYNKYMEINTENIFGNTIAFSTIYKTMYESLIDNGAYYWLEPAYDYSSTYVVMPKGNSMVNAWAGHACGIRLLISLDSNVKLSEKSIGTKTITSSDIDFKYNIWELK